MRELNRRRSEDAPSKPLSLAPVDLETRELPDGGLLLRSRQELEPHARCLGELLRHWAGAAPDRVFLAERPEASEGWRRLTYGEGLAAVERIAGALLARRLDGDRPVGSPLGEADTSRRSVAILSENGIDHALLQLAAMHVGIPVVPISTAYSLLSSDHARLRQVLALTRPGLIYAADGARFAPALAAALGEPGRFEIVIGANPPADFATTAFAELLAHPACGPAVEARFAEVGPETIAKVLFTSGSTGPPKGVVNTQRMLCSNQQAIAQSWPFLAERPPVIVDWLPWSHTFGGNHNFNMMLRHGGTLYIDAGKPLPGAIETTLRNLREVPSTLHFNVPRGYDMLVPFLRRDGALRECFFRDLDAIFNAAAALPPHLWEELRRLSVQATGKRVAMLAAWGSTETSPLAANVHFPVDQAGVIGLPAPGIEIKLAPVGSPRGGKLELRVRGPNVTPGYWRQPGFAAERLDEDGFLKMGDAGRLADPQDPSRGILFDGRLAENFKLMSGTWVEVGQLRTELIAAGAPAIQDVVVTGHDREEIGLLIFPNLAGCRSLCGGAADVAPLGELIRRPEVRARIRDGLARHNAVTAMSSRRIGRALLLAEPPAIDAGEITDKGYINQRAVLDRRAALVERLYAYGQDAELIRPDGEPAAGEPAASGRGSM